MYYIWVLRETNSMPMLSCNEIYINVYNEPFYYKEGNAFATNDSVFGTRWMQTPEKYSWQQYNENAFFDLACNKNDTVVYDMLFVCTRNISKSVCIFHTLNIP